MGKPSKKKGGSRPAMDVASILSRLRRPSRAVVTAGMPYANGPLHIGHLAGAHVPADIHARWLGMLIGRRNVLFVCGTDDHGSTSDVAAMKATGSHDVSLENVFVPGHHAIEVAQLRNLNGPGLKINKGALYRIPVLTFMAFGTIGPVVGGVEALFEMVNEILATL